MIVDASAILAILRHESDREAILAALTGDEVCRMSAGSRLELSVVVARLADPVLARKVDDLLDAVGLVVEPFTAEQAAVAAAAVADFGCGSGHPAKLNFGDCFSCALARVTGEPLLFKGEDFGHTDLTPVIAG